LIDAEEIPPNTEEGAEVAAVVLTILKNGIRNCRNFDYEQEIQELGPGEWIFVETAEESKCGQEVYIKYEGLKARIINQMGDGGTEMRFTRKQITKWLRETGRYYNVNASVNRRRCAYILPYNLVDKHQVFSYRNTV
jgi:hypothetical protein